MRALPAVVPEEGERVAAANDRFMPVFVPGLRLGSGISFLDTPWVSGRKPCCFNTLRASDIDSLTLPTQLVETRGEARLEIFEVIGAESEDVLRYSSCGRQAATAVEGRELRRIPAIVA